MWDYTDKVKELYMHPKNVGKIENADAVAEVGSIVCGDALIGVDRDDHWQNRRGG
jgi:NifU-like protein